MSETHSGVYLVRPDRTIVCHERLPHQEEFNLERLRFKTVIHNNRPPGSFWLGKMHPIEGESADLQEEVIQPYPFSRIEAWTAHELADQTHSREYIVPINGHHTTVPGKVIRLENGAMGKVVDMNRQYVMPLALARDWDSVIGNIAYGPARLPLQLMREHPGVKAVVSIHEDTEHSMYPYPFVKLIPRIRKQDGVYLYDIKAYENDPFDLVVDRQMATLRKLLKSHGVTLFNGIDDPSDPHLGNRVRDGLVRQTVYGKDGRPHLDNTLELFLVYLQTIGLTDVQRAFIIEVPGKSARNQKREILKMATDAFFLPVLGEMGAL